MRYSIVATTTITSCPPPLSRRPPCAINLWLISTSAAGLPCASVISAISNSHMSTTSRVISIPTAIMLIAAVAYYEEGHTLIETGKIFKVGKSTVSAWVKKKKETGDLSNKPLNRSFKKIDPEKLKAYVKEHPDETQKEMAEAFGCCNQAIIKALKRCGITRKKRQHATKNRILKK